ncbi:hypothetical protein NDK43_17255 [Neobacillus pocheonensis]|uniref:Uncharacterized protein n=1 Tax=Neobacillus pocheonensis TaxID=363869 RepID=A0ABT0WBX8_9BACI|nr:hypothetical protein [Neobacillus pocheonensis]
MRKRQMNPAFIVYVFVFLMNVSIFNEIVKKYPMFDNKDIKYKGENENEKTLASGYRKN